MEHAHCRQRVFECVSDSRSIHYFNATWLSRQVTVRYLPLQFIVFLFFYDFNFSSLTNLSRLHLFFRPHLLNRYSISRLHAVFRLLSYLLFDRYHFLKLL